MEVENVVRNLVVKQVLEAVLVSVVGMEVEIVASYVVVKQVLEAVVDSVKSILHSAIDKAVRKSLTQRVDTVQTITRRNRSNITADYKTSMHSSTLLTPWF